MKIKGDKDYSDIMNLPKNTIPTDGNLPKRQEYFLEKIQDEARYRQALEKNKLSSNRYRIDNSPIKVDNVLDTTVVLNKILKDIFVRFQIMSGNIVDDKIIFSDSGLEDNIKSAEEKDIGNNKADIQSGLKERQEAKKRLADKLRRQLVEINNLGTVINYTRHYKLMSDSENENKIITNFLHLYKQGRLHRKLIPVHWCIKCKSPLEQNEMTHEDIKVKNYYILYKIIRDRNDLFEKYGNPQNLYFIATTIAPWTMTVSENIALAEDTKYSLVQVFENGAKKFFVLASDKVEEFMQYNFYIKYVVLEEFEAIKLKRILCSNPLNYTKTVKVTIAPREYIYVDEKNTSGIRIVSSGATYLDYLIFKDFAMGNIRSALDENGKTNPIALVYNNTYYKEVGEKIVKFLQDNNFIYYSNNVKTTIQKCKTCQEELIYRIIPEWYLMKENKISEENFDNILSRITANEKYKKEELVAQIKKINQQEKVVVSNNKCIGLPIPVFYCAQCNELIVSDMTNELIGNLFKEKGIEAWYKESPEQILKGQVICPKCRCTFLFKDSGNLNEFFKYMSMDMIDEDENYKDIAIESKTSFYRKLKGFSFASSFDEQMNTIYKAMIHSDVEENMQLAENKEKFLESNTENKTKNKDKNKNKKKEIDKKVANVVEEKEMKSEEAVKTIASKYGTDILRLWAISKSNENTIKLNEHYIINTNKAYKTIRKTFKFLLSNLTDFNPLKDYVNVLDRKDIDSYFYGIAMKFNIQIYNAYNNLEFKKVYELLTKLCKSELSAKYFDVIKYRLYVLKKDSKKRRSTQSTMYDILMYLVMFFEPILPFTLEEVWQYIWHKDASDEKNILICRQKLIKEEIDITKEAEKWDRIFKLITWIKKSINKAKNDKIIKNSLEAFITLNVKQETKEFIEANFDDVYLSLNISELNLVEAEEESVEVAKHEGVQCAMCHQYSIYIGRDLKYRYICPRCAEVMEGQHDN
ncbi:MAG: class I tRNA ligase family protein [Clostridia bacterium]|nr:class I tRNA ligase family protein [Clostridia bacterium]